MAGSIFLHKWPAENCADSLSECRTSYSHIVELNLIKAADMEKRFQIRAAKPAFVSERDVEAGVWRRSFHVGCSQQERTSGLKCLVNHIRNPEQRVFWDVLDNV